MHSYILINKILKIYIIDIRYSNVSYNNTIFEYKSISMKSLIIYLVISKFDTI